MRMLCSVDLPWLSSVMFISFQDVFLICFSIASTTSFAHAKLKVCTAARHMRAAWTQIHPLTRAPDLSSHWGHNLKLTLTAQVPGERIFKP